MHRSSTTRVLIPRAEPAVEIAGIGRILIVEASATAETVEGVADASNRCPWIPIVVELGNTPSAEVRLALRILPFAVRAQPGTLRNFEAAAAALRRCPALPSNLHHYMELRCAKPDTANLIYSSLQDEPWVTLSMCRSGYYAAFRKLGSISSAVWKRILLVAPFAGHGLSVNRLASELGRDARTIRHAIQHDVGVRPSFFASTPGWQWVLEVGLLRSRIHLRAAMESHSELPMPPSVARLPQAHSVLAR